MEVVEVRKEQVKQTPEEQGMQTPKENTGATESRRDSYSGKIKLPEIYDFPEPQKIDTQRLEGKSYSKAAELADSRVKSLHHIMHELMKGEEKSHEDEIATIDKAVAFLKSSTEEARKIVTKEMEEKGKYIEQLHKQKDAHSQQEVKYQEAKQKLRQLESSITETKKDLIQRNEGKVKAAAEIMSRLDLLKNIKIADPKSDANELFVWFLGVCYGEPITKYEFKNFKTETFKKDKGVDFGNRIKGLKVFNLDKESVALTTKTLENKNKIVEALNFKQKQPNQAVEDSFNFIQIVHDINEVADKLHKSEAQLEQSSIQADVTHFEFMKIDSRQRDIQTNIEISEKAITTFSRIVELFQKSEELCKHRKELTNSKLPHLKQKTIQPELIAELGQTVQEGQEEEEAVQSGASLPEGVQKHARVSAGNYGTDLSAAPKENTEGCQCTIF